jgi:hypothetical protein
MTTVAEYLLRVRPCADGYTATLRRFEPTPHAEVRAIVGPVSTGAGPGSGAEMPTGSWTVPADCVLMQRLRLAVALGAIRMGQG